MFPELLEEYFKTHIDMPYWGYVGYTDRRNTFLGSFIGKYMSLATKGFNIICEPSLLEVNGKSYFVIEIYKLKEEEFFCYLDFSFIQQSLVFLIYSRGIK